MYFELASKPKPEPITLEGVTPSKLPGDLGKLQTFGRFLAQQKKLQVPPK